MPDVLRAAEFISSLKQYEAADNLPNLVILWLPNDHTSGTEGQFPRPPRRWPTTTSRSGKSSRP